MADAPPTTRIVVTPNPVGVGQSIGGPGTNSNLNQPAFDLAAISASNIPNRWLDGPNPGNKLTIMRFPTDTPPYYLSLAINDYSRESWVKVGVLNETHRIILPLPQQMIDNANVRYDISDIGFAGAAGFALINGQKAQAAEIATAGLASAALKGIASGTGNVGAGTAKVFNGALGAVGLAVNDFMTIMLKGPDYRKRDFIWRFSPKTAQETSDLRRIIQLINNSMSPALAGIGSAFFAWPKIFLPEFTCNGVPELLALNTFRMKPSVITDFSLNYTPNGTFSPFATTKAPTSVEMRISFLELEFWLSGNYSDQQTSTPGKSTSNLVNGIINPSLPSGSFNGVGTSAVAP